MERGPEALEGRRIEPGVVQGEAGGGGRQLRSRRGVGMLGRGGQVHGEVHLQVPEVTQVAEVLVAEHVRTGIQGPSGVVLEWEISAGGGITRAQLVRTAGSISAGYGIDDLVLVTMPVAVDHASFSGVKALFR